METKGLTCKIPLELHNQISEDIRAAETTVSKFIEMVIREHYENKEKEGEKIMGKTRTLAFIVDEELFQGVKRYLDWYEVKYSRRLTQKDFVIDLIKAALAEVEDEIAAYEAGQTEQRAPRWAANENPADGGAGPEDTETPAEGDDEGPMAKSEESETPASPDGGPEDDEPPTYINGEPENAESPTDGTEN